MTSHRYQKTLNRQQDMLLLERVEDYVSENNRVRAIDVYVNTLERQGLGVKYADGVSQAGQHRHTRRKRC